MRKKFVLLRNSFSHFLKSEKVILILILSGMIIGYLTFLLISGILNYQMKALGGGNTYNSISVVFNGGDNNEDNISAFFNDEPLGELYNALIICIEDKGPNVIGWKGTSFTRWHAMEAGSSFFTSGQSESDENIAIISDNYAGLEDKTFDLEGNEYTIIGKLPLTFPMFIRQIPLEINYNVDEYGNTDTVIIPYKAFIKNGFKANILRLDLKKSIHINENSNMDILKNYFKNQQIFFSDSVYKDEAQINRVALVRIAFTGLCILALLSIFSLFNYWIKLNKKQYFIYQICGSSNSGILVLIALEWLVINIISFILAFSLFLLIRIPLVNLDISFDISVVESSLLFVSGFVLSLLFSIGTVLKVSNGMNRNNLKGEII